jgi:lysophospholipase
MTLFSSEKNPLPPDTLSGYVYTPDSLRIRYALWKTTQLPYRGSVLILHGRGEFIEKYYETATELAEAGYDVCTFDWRGQGGSSRVLHDPKRGYVDNFDQYLLDLDTVLADVVLADCRPPHAILAHSTGALAALLAAPNLANRIQRMVFCAPLLRFSSMPLSHGLIKYLSGTLTMIGLGEIYLLGGSDMNARRQFADNPLTSDTRRFDRNFEFVRMHPDISIGGPTAAWIFAACQAMDRVADPDHLGEIHIPTLLIAAGNDKVVSNQAIEELGYILRSGKTITIDGARHEILQERDIFRGQFMAAFTAFIPGEAHSKIRSA